MEEVVCAIGQSYLRVCRKRQKKLPSVLKQEQTVLLYSLEDEDEAGQFITSILPLCTPCSSFSLLPKGSSYWILQEFAFASPSYTWRLHLQAILASSPQCVTFLQPTSSLQISFLDNGLSAIVEYLEKRYMNVTILAPKKEFYEEIVGELGRKGYCLVNEQVKISPETLLKSYLGIAKCNRCGHLANKAVYTPEFPAQCYLCHEGREFHPYFESKIWDKIAGELKVTCRCGVEVSGQEVDRHTVMECRMKEWHCQQCHLPVSSGVEYLDHYLEHHFTQLCDRLNQLVD